MFSQGSPFFCNDHKFSKKKMLNIHQAVVIFLCTIVHAIITVKSF